MEQILQYFEQKVTLSDKDGKVFSSKLRHKTVSKQHHLFRVGQIENCLSFVETRINRLYIPKEKAEDYMMS